MTLIIALIVIALVLFFLEIFLPGGILGILGFGCLLGASYLTYDSYGLVPGIAVLVGSLILSVAFFIIELKFLSSKGVGKFLRSEGSIKGGANTPAGDDSLVGQQGTALTTMAPSGRVRIGKQNYEASAQGGYVSRGAAIEVVRVESFKLIIKPLP
ncbi:NfeD family protein [Ruficoccus sp. ZRK36]|uniref:NfeD family protein n=1 Tax=Ruficoccus sp. ZRK36 TaxID=2866311 RepID=UPI001C72FAE6|nr:NfeD family protein [Ruficoccus sp. ZRK36]QYY36484.1 NfeD family protein [Ruficoccus sp. ZRK36]